MILVVVVLMVVAAVIGAVPLFYWIADRREAAARSLPPLFYPLTSNARESLVTAQLLRERVPVARAAAVDPPRLNHRPSSVAVLDTIDGEQPSPTETVRFARPVDEPVQLLPGRLEVLAGETGHHEIRFVRIPGEPLQLILGRDAGPSPQYVGLGSVTVSRRHAHLAYADGRWMVKNLSQTNPLVVNDDELSDPDAERPLVNGDRLQLGEVVLRFHAH